MATGLESSSGTTRVRVPGSHSPCEGFFHSLPGLEPERYKPPVGHTAPENFELYVLAQLPRLMSDSPVANDRCGLARVCR